jgi:putative Mn2+ efflux pump MntP
MPVIGLALGAPLGEAVGGAADYLAIGVLLAFGLYTLLLSEQHEQERLGQLTQMRGFGALLLGFSISLDELAIGFTLGLLRLPAGLVIVLIAFRPSSSRNSACASEAGSASACAKAPSVSPTRR